MVRFESELVEKYRLLPDEVQEMAEIVLFNANFSANDKCPKCHEPKRKEQRESWFTFIDNTTYTFHVWRNVASNTYIIRDCK